MAENRILQQFGSFVDFVHSGFKYNLQVFPDTLTAATLLFALLFQSPPFATLGGSILALNVIYPFIANFLTSFIGGTSGRSDSCSGRFPGISITRMVKTASDKKFGALSNDWPSYYTVFLGFLTAYAAMMPYIYRKELDASPKRNIATIVGLVVMALILLIGLVYRIFSSCDTVFSSLLGCVVGLILGLLFVVILAYLSERRLTNILSLPLIRDKTTDGKPIYVCERT